MYNVLKKKNLKNSWSKRDTHWTNRNMRDCFCFHELALPTTLNIIYEIYFRIPQHNPWQEDGTYVIYMTMQKYNDCSFRFFLFFFPLKR